MIDEDAAVKLQIHQAPADDSELKMSSLRRSLPSSESSADVRPIPGVNEPHSVGSNLDPSSAAEDITIHGDREGVKHNYGSLASETYSVSSTVSSSIISSDQDTSSLHSFDVESHIARDMAAEILVLLDQLESSFMTAFDELQSLSVSEDAHNSLQLIFQGFFFTHLWNDILSFHRCTSNVFEDRLMVLLH